MPPYHLHHQVSSFITIIQTPYPCKTNTLGLKQPPFQRPLNPTKSCHHSLRLWHERRHNALATTNVVTLYLCTCPYTHDAEEVSVGGADVNLRLDKRLPLLDEGAKLVAGKVHAVEVRQHRSALDIFAAQLYFPVTLSIISKSADKGVYM